jgi:hypothetical protein
MPVKRCPDCQGTVSASAAKCPHCGRVMKQLDFFRVLILLLIVVAVLFLLGTFLPRLNPQDFAH